MTTSFARRGAVLASLAAVAASASAQTLTPAAPSALDRAVLELDAAPLGRVSIESFGRADDSIIFATPVDASGGSTSVPWWDNGACDEITAHLSQAGDTDNFCTADDCFLKPGFFAFVDEVRVIFAVDNRYNETMNKPSFKLTAYADCNGQPDTSSVAFTITDPDDISYGLIGAAPWPGFSLWAVSYSVGEFVGEGRAWLCPQGCGELADGFYYWVSANNGVIQGAMAHIKNNAEPWQDVLECDCPGICTDMCLTITGHVCCLLKNNMPYDPTGGATSLQLFGAQVDTARAADNFQVPPGDPIEVCAIEAWMATNCPLDKIFVEIYENDCDCPGDLVCVIDVTTDEDGDGKADYPIATPTGDSYLGCDIYHLFWPEISRVVLEPGRDYWISVVAQGTGSILDKAYWMYKTLSTANPCDNICITEGKVKDPFVAGLEMFTFVSVATSGEPRDFAFKLYSRDGVFRADDDQEPVANTTLSGSTPHAPRALGAQLTR